MSLEYLTVTMFGGISGICLLALSFVLINRPTLPSNGLLAMLLLSIMMLAAPSWLAVVEPALFVVFLSLSLLACMSLGPLLWLYVDSLTSTTEWCFSYKKFPHFIPLTISIAVLLVACFASKEDIVHMVSFALTPESGLLKSLAIIVWMLLLLWIPQSIYYLFLIGTRLVKHRKRLKDVFSNTEERELRWLLWLSMMVAVLWLVLIVNLFTSTLLNVSFIKSELLTLIALLSVWVLAQWGLHQKPAFSGHYSRNGIVAKDSEAPVKKYDRSTIAEDRALEIANRIENIIISKKAYLDSDLTVSDLANSIDTRSHLVSQVLNEYMGVTFFDYVNTQRIEAAKGLLVETDKSAFDIGYEVGFNARSSFYKAFKNLTGTTPAHYRKINT